MTTDIPNMRSELFDAIDFYFADMPDVAADCLLYLSKLQNNEEMVNALSHEARNRLNQMNRCERCGEPFKFYHYKEWHDEVNAYEDMTDVYCPNCDTPYNEKENAD